MNTNKTNPKRETGAWVAKLNRDDLVSDNLPENPYELFAQWFAEAAESNIIEPTGATLATADAQARPSARTVLVKTFDEQGFYFYSNYASQKGQDLTANPHAALLFWWDEQERQVRIEGVAKPLTPAASDAYFARRPRGSQIGAHASPQSREIASRSELETRVKQVEEQFNQRDIPRPEHWGGYRLSPRQIEFWQGRKNRLHDRVRYQYQRGSWSWQRLAP